jgi:hypothetical protein
VVDVEDAVLAPANLGELRGRKLTVVLATAAKKGDRAIWWATSWLYGNEIAVIETGRTKPVKLMEAASQITEERLRALDERILARLAGAELVIAGEVRSIEDLGLDNVAEGTTWRLAFVRVSGILKGRPDAEIIIQFPGAGSPRWANAPRMVANQQSIWILRRASKESRMRTVKAEGTWVALEPEDVHALSGLARIEVLIRLGAIQNRSSD